MHGSRPRRSRHAGGGLGRTAERRAAARRGRAHRGGEIADRRVREAVWSDCFRRPPAWQCLLWVLRNLPAVVLLLASDRRDGAVVCPPPRDEAPRARLRREAARALRLDITLDDDELSFFRLFARIVIAALLLKVGLVAAAGSWLVGGTLVIAVVVYLTSRLNVIGHVVVAATDSVELGKIHDRVLECLTWARGTARQVIVVAHSQGGYVAHAVLANDDASRGRAVDLVGIGSGLKPIWLLRQLERRGVLAAAWIGLLSVAAMEWVLLGVLGTMTGLGDAVRGLLQLTQLAVVPIEALTPSSVRAVLSDAQASFSGALAADLRLGPWQWLGLTGGVGGLLVSARMFRRVVVIRLPITSRTSRLRASFRGTSRTASPRGSGDARSPSSTRSTTS
jgi:hypothetical protein